MINNLLERLEGVKGGNGKWMACCPAHGDKRPSLAIKELDDGRILLKCFAGCNVEEITGAIGMNVSDLFPPDETVASHRVKGAAPAKRAFYASDLLKIIEFEALVVSVAAADISKGKEISEADRARLKLAHERIQEAINYIK